MVTVITYGTYDLLHYGHIRLLERAKALGDYLIVGVTADDFDKSRGKINVQQSLIQRVEGVRSTGIADEIIIEEYEGQKIDDIKKYNVDIFTVGSDWIGKFDYLKEYCKVIYLDRTEGISSSEIRGKNRELKIGFVGDSPIINKVIKESKYVNGLQTEGIYTDYTRFFIENIDNDIKIYNTYDELLEAVDAVYVISSPINHETHIKQALRRGKHVLCESPIVTDTILCKNLFDLAKKKKCILMEAIKTAYSTAYHRMLLMIKSGIIGRVLSIDATCTSIREFGVNDEETIKFLWNSICAWGPTAMLPIFQLFGTNYKQKQIISDLNNEEARYDSFTKINFLYDTSVASIKVGQGVKSEGDLVISGTKGYVYVPAPWWKTEYFEVRFERAENNRRYFYQLEGEGIRQELVSFVRAIETGQDKSNISEDVSKEIAHVIGDFYSNIDTILI